MHLAHFFILNSSSASAGWAVAGEYLAGWPAYECQWASASCEALSTGRAVYFVLVIAEAHHLQVSTLGWQGG
jgi:hypothetical protein